ncbi:MAG: YicC/YloC family endoribonuclease [Christensenellaceae bacterium]
MGKLLSMTGYGSAKGSVEGQEITVELKSVNNRYLDCSVRLPRNFLFAEDTVKQAVSAGVSRGKVDVFVSAQASQDSGTVVSVNEELARGYRDAVARIAETLGLESGLNAFSLARFPDVLTVERRELDKDKAAAALSEITAKAVEEFNAMREREGERLRRDMLGKLETIEGLVSVVEERSPQTVKEYRERLEARLRDILADRSLDEQRVITEAAIFADRTAVDEETVRLRSHIAQFRTMLEEGSPIGRKMDFLVQEFNRESNTIGSKCSDASLAKVVVDLKSEIEKIREQLQNVE